MVAEDAGFELDWSNTGVDRFKRAELYVARDMHMIDANFDFSNDHLNKLAKTNLTDTWKTCRVHECWYRWVFKAKPRKTLVSAHLTKSSKTVQKPLI